MLDFSEEVVKSLTSLDKVIDMREHKTDLDMMVKTNWKNEVRRRGKRSHDVVVKHTAVGLGAEIAVQSTGLFEQAAPITENAEGLTFAQRKKDVFCEGKSGEIKTMNAKYPFWYISDSQAESVMYSTRFNQFFLIVAYEEVQSLKYRYRPRYLVDSNKLSEYIVKNARTGTGFSSYRFDHVRAIQNGHCVDLWSNQ
jgi:hypothetical protein